VSLCFRITKSAVIVAAVVGSVSLASARTTSAPPHVSLQKTIGQAKPEVVPSLIAMNSKGASLRDGKLVLVGIAPNAIVFADRPVRAAGHDLTANVIDDWTKGTDNFAKDPPNATVSSFTKDESGVKDAIVVLKNPKLEGDLKGADGAASVFIDIIGRPLTPLSYAGVARHIAALTTRARPQPRVQQPQRITRLTTARPPAVNTRIRPATEEKTCANS